MNEYAGTNAKEYAGTNAKELREPKMSVAEEVIKAQRILLDRIGQIEDRMHNQLSAVMVSECPTSGPSTCAATTDSEWPPLFNELRDIERATNQTLTRINVLLDRVRI